MPNTNNEILCTTSRGALWCGYVRSHEGCSDVFWEEAHSVLVAFVSLDRVGEFDAGVSFALEDGSALVSGCLVKLSAWVEITEDGFTLFP